MKKSLFVCLFLISGLFVEVFSSAVTFYAGNDFYLREDRIDTLNSSSDLFFNFGLAAEDLGGSGLSFQTDLLASNAFYDKETGGSTRQKLELSTAYLNWRNASGGLNFRLGRQIYTNLGYDAIDFDGLRVKVRPNKKTSLNVASGLLVPSPYAKITSNQIRVYQEDGTSTLQPVYDYHHYLLSDPGKAAFATFDGSFSAIPFTTLNAAVSYVPPSYMHPVMVIDSVPGIDAFGNPTMLYSKREKKNKGDLNMALGLDLSPVPFIRLTGSGRLSFVQKGVDRFDGRLTVLPTKMLEVSAYALTEKGRIDSTNYFSVMFQEQLYEYGLILNLFPETDISVQVDAHFVSVEDEGADVFFTFDASNSNLNLGIALGTGYHGSIIRPYGGFRLPFLKVFTLEGTGEFFRAFPDVYVPVPWVPTPDSMGMLPEIPQDSLPSDDGAEPVLIKKGLSPYNAVLLSGGLKIAIPPAGLTFFPRIEYIMNRYYINDIRFLLTTNLLLRKYRGNRK